MIQLLNHNVKRGGLSILIASSVFAVLLVLMITFYFNLMYKLHSAEKSSLQSLEKKSRIASKYSGLIVSSDYLVSTRGNITILGIVTSEGFKKLNLTGQKFNLKYLRQVAKSDHFIVMTSSGPIEINYELMSEDHDENSDFLHVLTNHWILTKLPVKINPYSRAECALIIGITESDVYLLIPWRKYRPFSIFGIIPEPPPIIVKISKNYFGIINDYGSGSAGFEEMSRDLHFRLSLYNFKLVVVNSSENKILMNLTKPYRSRIEMYALLDGSYKLLKGELSAYCKYDTKCVVKVKFSGNLGQNFKLLVYALDNQWSYFMMYSVTRHSPLEITVDSSLINYHVDVITPE